MSTEIVVSDKAFMSIILSSIEVYRNECLGILLGYRTHGRIIVEYAIPLQTAERTPSEVTPNWRREAKVLEVLPNLIQLEKLGYFHSHPQLGEEEGIAEPSEADIESMEEGEVELIVAINDSTRRISWRELENMLCGTLGEYQINIAGYYIRTSDNELMQYRVVCPYAVGFDHAFTS